MNACEDAIKKEKIEFQRGGTYVVMEGPQFSTLAESNLYDQRTWGRETWVFVDTGKAMPDHLPLLKERYHLRRADARLLWEGLMAQGWLKTQPAWGVYAEP